MSERGIIFNGFSVRAFLDGRKTMTRRIFKRPKTVSLNRPIVNVPGVYPANCPYGVPGDRLVFLGTWAVPKKYDEVRPSRLPRRVTVWTVYEGTEKPTWCGRKRHGRYVPRFLYDWFPRGELTAVRVERVRDISEEDAENEGILFPSCGGKEPCLVHDVSRPFACSFARVWDSIHGEGAFMRNDYVWVLTFRRVS